MCQVLRSNPNPNIGVISAGELLGNSGELILTLKSGPQQAPVNPDSSGTPPSSNPPAQPTDSGGTSTSQGSGQGAAIIDLNVKPTVTNQKLQNTVDQLYRTGATIGNGSTADAIRQKVETGQLVGGKSHITKGLERIANLENILRSQQLDAHDTAVAQALLHDLRNALNGK